MIKPTKTILVTGHAGFIGSHLTRKLLQQGFKVVGVDNFNDFYDPKIKEKNVAPFLKNPHFKQYKLDILDLTGLKRVFEDILPQKVIHLAARAGVRPSIVNPALYEEVNVKGTLHLLELSRQFRVKQFIFASSSSIYGNQKKLPFSETDPVNQPVSPYAATKKAAEMLGYTYSFIHDLPTTVLRFFTVYGPAGRPDMAVYQFTEKLFKDEPITRFGDGSTQRDFTFIDDIIEGVLATLARPFRFEVINLGHNQPIKLNQLIRLLEKLTGKKAKILEQPRNSADVPVTFADITKAKKLLGWQPKTDLKTGLKRFVDWYQQQ